MKKFISPLFIIFLLTGILACTKDPAVMEPAGQPMELSADFGLMTKTAYTPDGEILKGGWDASETISVVTLSTETNGKVVAIDNFTSTGAQGRKEAVFSGVYTGGTTPTKVIVIYPALQEKDGKYSTIPYTDYLGNSVSLLQNAQLDNRFFASSGYSPLKQTVNNDCSHFKNYCALTGLVNTSDIKENKLSVTMQNLLTVLKFNINFDEKYVGKKLNKLHIRAVDSEFNPKQVFNNSGWNYVDLVNNGLATSTSKTSLQDIYSDITIPDSKIVTLYLPLTGLEACATNDMWIITPTVDNTDLMETYFTFLADISPEIGKMYTINVSHSL